MLQNTVFLLCLAICSLFDSRGTSYTVINVYPKPLSFPLYIFINIA